MRYFVIICLVLLAMCSSKVTTGYPHQIIKPPVGEVSAEPVVTEFAPEDSVVSVQEQVMRVIYFEFDKSDLSGESVAVLDGLIKLNIVSVSIEGHCDNRGSDGYNMALGERRAKAAGLYLARNGVPIEKIGSRSFGESAPVVSGCRDERCHAGNRRDVIRLVAIKP